MPFDVMSMCCKSYLTCWLIKAERLLHRWCLRSRLAVFSPFHSAILPLRLFPVAEFSVPTVSFRGAICVSRSFLAARCRRRAGGVLTKTSGAVVKGIVDCPHLQDVDCLITAEARASCSPDFDISHTAEKQSLCSQHLLFICRNKGF